jgi:hypothetical protein
VAPRTHSESERRSIFMNRLDVGRSGELLVGAEAGPTREESETESPLPGPATASLTLPAGGVGVLLVTCGVLMPDIDASLTDG